MKVLITVDGSELALRAVTHAVKVLSGWGAQPGAGAEAHVLTVQPSVRGNVGRFVSKDDLDDYHREEGMKVIEPARAALEQAGINCVPHIGVGDPGPVIDQYARDLGVDMIIMGTRGLGNIADLVLGSTTEDVLRLTERPVLLVK